MNIEIGQMVLVSARVIGRANDKRPEDQKGYIIETDRGESMRVDPHSIFLPLISQIGKKQVKHDS